MSVNRKIININIFRNSLKNVGDTDQDAGKDGFIDELDITDTEDGKTLRTSSPFFKVYYRCFI